MKTFLFGLLFAVASFAQTTPSGSLSLTWTSNSAGKETAFVIQRSTDGQSWSDVGRVGRNVTIFIDQPPLPDAPELSYRVRAIDEVNNLTSDYSAPATIKMTPTPTPTPKPPTSIAKPTNVKGVKNP
jgi:hypothetical protein